MERNELACTHFGGEIVWIKLRTKSEFANNRFECEIQFRAYIVHTMIIIETRNEFG